MNQPKITYNLDDDALIGISIDGELIVEWVCEDSSTEAIQVILDDFKKVFFAGMQYRVVPEAH